MRLMLEEVIDMRWTELIHAEWTRNVLQNRPDLTITQLRRVCDLMNLHAENALVNGFEHLIDDLKLPDLDDRHVLAAAIHARASVIVTFNLKDFPNAILESYGIRAIHPDEFVMDAISHNLEAVLTAMRKQRSQLKKPALTAMEFLAQLEQQGLSNTANRLAIFHEQF